MIIKPKLNKESSISQLKPISYPPEMSKQDIETNNQFKPIYNPNKPIVSIENQNKLISYQTNMNTDTPFNLVNLNTTQNANNQPKPIIYLPQVKPCSYPTIFNTAGYLPQQTTNSKPNTFTYQSYPCIPKYQLKPVSFPLTHQSIYNQPKQAIHQSNPAINNYQMRSYPTIKVIPTYPPKPKVINNQFSQKIHQNNKIYGSSEYTRM
jgi:hypothetical protein